MIDMLAAVTIALAMLGIAGMVLVPTTATHSRLRRIVQRPTRGRWLAKYLRPQFRRVTANPWWSVPFQGL
jgi:hypothetical protein